MASVAAMIYSVKKDFQYPGGKEPFAHIAERLNQLTSDLSAVNKELESTQNRVEELEKRIVSLEQPI